MFHDTDGWQMKHYNSVKFSHKYNSWIVSKNSKQAGSARNLFYGLSLPGFRNFMDPNKSKFQKRLWLLIFLCCFSLSMVQISERVYYFQQYPVSMTITYERSSDFYFPKICFCHFHAFIGTKIMQQFGKLDYKSLFDQFRQTNLTVEDIWKMTGYDLDTFLVDCTYGKKSCKNETFWEEVMTIMGRCQVLTINERVRYGPSSRLRITLRDQPFPPKSEIQHLGWRLYLHDDTANIQYETLSSGMMANRNSRTSLMYWYKKYVYENTPVKPCANGEKMKKCHDRCNDIMFLNKTASCRLPFMKTLDEYPLCTIEEFINFNVFPLINSMPYDVTKCGCINPCFEIAFDVQPDGRHMRNENLTLVEIFPSRSEIEIMKEIRAYTIASLISDIGGALGFYLGACILTCFEILDCIIRMFIRKLITKKDNQAVN